MYVVVHAVSGALVWGAVGAFIEPLGVHLERWLVVVGLVYAALYGLSEVLGVRIPALNSAWQVPPSWVRSRSRLRDLIWGATLGPGIMTHNPYAGMWFLPFLIALQPNVWSAFLLGCGIGASHGGARAATLLALHSRGVTCSALRMLAWRARCRFIDGLILLVGAGAILGLAVY